MRSGLRGLRQGRIDHFARRVHVDMSESLRRGEHAPDPTAQVACRLCRGRPARARRARPPGRSGRRVDPSDAPRTAPGSAAASLGSGRATGPLARPWRTRPERRHGRRTPGRVTAALRRQTVVVRPLPSLGQRDGRVGADADIAPLPLEVKSLNPSLVSPCPSGPWPRPGTPCRPPDTGPASGARPAGLSVFHCISPLSTEKHTHGYAHTQASDSRGPPRTGTDRNDGCVLESIA